MNKYVCIGAIVTNKKGNQSGKVISVDRKSGVAVVQNGSNYWTDQLKNVEVTSYKEVE